MLTYVYGDLVEAALQGKVDIMVQGCNCFCTMGGGIARDIREKIPEAYTVDCTTKKGDRSKLGSQTTVQIEGRNGKTVTIINAYTQYTFWDPNDMFSIDALRSCFTTIKNRYGTDDPNFRRIIGIPLIGAGLAQGNWGEISSVLEEINFGERNLYLVVYVKFEKDWKDIVVMNFPSLMRTSIKDLPIL